MNIDQAEKLKALIQREKEENMVGGEEEKKTKIMLPKETI